MTVTCILSSTHNIKRCFKQDLPSFLLLYFQRKRETDVGIERETKERATRKKREREKAGGGEGYSEPSIYLPNHSPILHQLELVQDSILRAPIKRIILLHKVVKDEMRFLVANLSQDLSLFQPGVYPPL